MMSSDQLNRESESHGYARPAMIGVGLVGPVPEQVSKEMQELLEPFVNLIETLNFALVVGY